MNGEAKNLFKPGLMISFRSAWKLSSCLVRAKLYPIERTVHLNALEKGVELV